MANAIYDLARQKFLNGQLAWGTGTGGDVIKLVLVDTAAYTFSHTHEFLSDIPSGDRIAISAAFTGKAVTNGIADADNVTLAAVTGDPSEALVIFKDTGTPATSPLIAYLDSVTGLPVTPNGGDITITFDNGSNKIFKL